MTQSEFDFDWAEMNWIMRKAKLGTFVLAEKDGKPTKSVSAHFQKLLLRVLFDHGSYCFLRSETIAAEANMKLPTVKKAIAALKRQRLIVVEKRRSNTLGVECNHFTILWNNLLDLCEIDREHGSQNREHGSQRTEHGSQETEHGSQETEHGSQRTPLRSTYEDTTKSRTYVSGCSEKGFLRAITDDELRAAVASAARREFTVLRKLLEDCVERKLLEESYEDRYKLLAAAHHCTHCKGIKNPARVLFAIVDKYQFNRVNQASYDWAKPLLKEQTTDANRG